MFDTEVVIVNLETGIYYSLRGSGIDIWRGIEGGLTSEQIVGAFASAGGDASAREHIAELEREQLIVPAATEQESSTGAALSVSTPFVSPILEKFTDMREMLLIDPIHELDEGGWPKKTDTKET